ncbi:MAG: DNA repair protein RecN, partial [Bacteroidales bacterium]|nr:DNA repair protein RecN [Bacteroidales bacterium]
GLILGKRADTSVFKDNDKKCIVEGEFQINNDDLQSLFAEYEIDYDRHTIIRREIATSGKSRAFINDSPVTLSQLQEIALHLIDIHSQHQNLSLNNQQFCLDIIDTYMGQNEDVRIYNSYYSKYLEAKNAYDQAKENIESLSKEKDYLEHRYNELQDAKLVPGELAELEEELKQLEHVEEIKTNLGQSLEIINNEEHGDVVQIKQVKILLEKISEVFHLAEGFASRFDNILIELKDLETELHTAFEKIDFNPDRYTFVQQRTSQVFELLQKYRVNNVDELIQERDSLQQKLSVIEDGGFNMDQLHKKLSLTQEKALELASTISKNRIASFNTISEQVVDILSNLGMPNTKLQFQREEKELSNNGIDKIKILFSANQAVALNEINKIASGGELSRLMLAIKSIISDSGNLPTIIFDEIDTGVSGEIADKVGNIIRKMADGMQVINITHLPQVASKGDYHFLVHKTTNEQKTTTSVKLLSDDERLQEIAKMLSGEELSEAALENARVLLNN